MLYFNDNLIINIFMTIKINGGIHLSGGMSMRTLPPIELSTGATNNYDVSSNVSITEAREIIVTVNGNIGSTDASFPAFTSGTLPDGSIVTIQNNATIQGKGGDGGDGGSELSGALLNGEDGEAGGNAIETTVKMFIFNASGQIIAGGGGGGGSPAANDLPNDFQFGHGGGGGAGSLGGSAGESFASGTSATDGTSSLGGTGGFASNTARFGRGGDGGDPAQAGDNAVRGTGPPGGRGTAGSGGIEGDAIEKNGNIVIFESGSGNVTGAII